VSNLAAGRVIWLFDLAQSRKLPQLLAFQVTSLSWIAVLPIGLREAIQMNVQIFNKPILAGNFWLETAIVIVTVEILIALVTKYAG
jgi:hypothetical protein